MFSVGLVVSQLNKIKFHAVNEQEHNDGPSMIDASVVVAKKSYVM